MCCAQASGPRTNVIAVQLRAHKGSPAKQEECRSVRHPIPRLAIARPIFFDIRPIVSPDPSHLTTVANPITTGGLILTLDELPITTVVGRMFLEHIDAIVPLV